tara:strand:+ start:395 stop:625 length:231 start_codon:yes stop_codon:yes gene_type:complete
VSGDAPAQARACGKCGGRSEEGFVLDIGYGEKKPARWVAGQPRTDWFGNVKYRKNEILPLRAFRCERCHFVEFYAD